MHYVSLLIEFLRGRPSAVFWTVALTQAVIWTLVPALFYSAPPGEAPLLLAVGHEFMLGSYLGPPLAPWLGEISFRAAGTFGLYALSQACIVLAYWAVFTLGRRIVGTRHAVLAVLLMVGISAFTVPTPNFGPAIMAAPFWALALLFYWRAIGDGERGNWFLLGIDLGVLLLANYAGIILVALLILFTLLTPAGRRALTYPEPWFGGVLFAIVIFPHAVWLWHARELVYSGLQDSIVVAGRLSPGLWLALTLVVTHLGLALLIFLTSGWPRKRRDRAPEIDRRPVASFARFYVFVFALAPALAAIAIAFVTDRLGPLDRITPLVVLSGLAAVVAGADKALIYRERFVSYAWLGLLIAPPAMVVLGLALLPWTFKSELAIAQPANAEGRFFGESFLRRTGKPLEYVTGDMRVAPLVALGAPSRPHVYFNWAPERSPWASVEDMRAHGGVVLWPLPGNTGAPPPPLKSQFPELVPEVPRAFPRPVQGFLPLIHMGWAMLRPQAAQP
jgi:Dolichyl-phosphate-mannose-protein mannosyltransferase